MKEKSVTERRQHVLLARAAGTPNGARTANLAAAGARGLSFSELHVLQPRLFRHSLSTDALEKNSSHSQATGRDIRKRTCLKNRHDNPIIESPRHAPRAQYSCSPPDVIPLFVFSTPVITVVRLSTCRRVCRIRAARALQPSLNHKICRNVSLNNNFTRKRWCTS